MQRVLLLVLMACLARGEEPGEEAIKKAYEAWAKEVVDAVRKADKDRTMELIDFTALVETATSGGPEDLRQKFLGEFTAAMKMRGGMLSEIISGVSLGVRFDLLRITVRDASPCARFRLASLQGGVNYIDLKMRLDKAGKVRGVDMYNHQNGEWVSSGLRRTFLQYVRDQRRSAWEKMIQGKEDWVQVSLGEEKMIELLRAGSPEKALEEYAALPEAVRKQKECMAIRIRIAMQIDDKKVEEAVREYLALYPDDPSATLVSLAGHTAAGRYAEALTSVDALDRAVGGDPYLDVVRADLLVKANEPGRARQVVLAAVEKNPDWQDAYLLLLLLELDAKRFKEVAGLLTTLHERFGWDPGSIEEAPDFAEFVKSPEYRAWQAARKKGG